MFKEFCETLLTTDKLYPEFTALYAVENDQLSANANADSQFAITYWLLDHLGAACAAAEITEHVAFWEFLFKQSVHCYRGPKRQDSIPTALIDIAIELRAISVNPLKVIIAAYYAITHNDYSQFPLLSDSSFKKQQALCQLMFIYSKVDCAPVKFTALEAWSINALYPAALDDWFDAHFPQQTDNAEEMKGFVFTLHDKCEALKSFGELELANYPSPPFKKECLTMVDLFELCRLWQRAIKTNNTGIETPVLYQYQCLEFTSTSPLAATIHNTLRGLTHV